MAEVILSGRGATLDVTGTAQVVRVPSAKGGVIVNKGDPSATAEERADPAYVAPVIFVQWNANAVAANYTAGQDHIWIDEGDVADVPRGVDAFALITNYATRAVKALYNETKPLASR